VRQIFQRLFAFRRAGASNRRANVRTSASSAGAGAADSLTGATGSDGAKRCRAYDTVTSPAAVPSANAATGQTRCRCPFMVRVASPHRYIAKDKVLVLDDRRYEKLSQSVGLPTMKA
jgi:hypothetical protein